MEKTLNFTIDGKEYKLAFTRSTIIRTEDLGFNIALIYDKPIKSLTLLWRGAFLANHSSLPNEEIEALFEKIDKEGLMDALIDIYKAPVESLFVKDGEDSPKNAVKWTVK